MDHLGTLGQLYSLVMSDLTVLSIGLEVKGPEKYDLYIGCTMVDFVDWSPENIADIVIEQTRGPAQDLARIVEFLVKVDKMFLIFCEFDSEGNDSYSSCNFLANCTTFRIPGYFSHSKRFALDVGSDG